MSRGDPLYTAYVALEVPDINGPWELDKRNEHVEARTRQSMKATQSLDHHYLGLSDNLK